jgi:hypothetical protein
VLRGRHFKVSNSFNVSNDLWALHTSNPVLEDNSSVGVQVSQIPQTQTASVVTPSVSATKTRALKLQQLRDAARQSQFRRLSSQF